MEPTKLGHSVMREFVLQSSFFVKPEFERAEDTYKEISSAFKGIENALWPNVLLTNRTELNKTHLRTEITINVKHSLYFHEIDDLLNAWSYLYARCGDVSSIAKCYFNDLNGEVGVTLLGSEGDILGSIKESLEKHIHRQNERLAYINKMYWEKKNSKVPTTTCFIDMITVDDRIVYPMILKNTEPTKVDTVGFYSK